MADEKVQKKFDALQFLMNKHGRDKFMDRVNKEAAKKAISENFWVYPKPGEKAIITMLIAPEATISDAFSRSGGVGYVGTMQDSEGVHWPIGLTETQVIDMCGEMQSHFRGWTPDFGLKVIEGLSFEVETRGWKAEVEKEGKKASEDRKKSTFTVIIDEAYNRKQVQFAEQLKEVDASGTGVDITADMFGMTPSPTATPMPTPQ